MGNVARVADDNQPAGARMDDVVNTLAQGTAWSDNVQGPQQPGILTFR